MGYDDPVTSSLTHRDDEGRVRMVDVGGKPRQRREASAEGFFRADPGTIETLLHGVGPKGEAIATARIAGIAAAKRTGEIIPLCHPLPLDWVSVDIEPETPNAERLRIVARVATTARTGVEMEALTAVSAAALTLYDMAKAIDRDLRIEDIRLVKKIKQDVE